MDRSGALAERLAVMESARITYRQSRRKRPCGGGTRANWVCVCLSGMPSDATYSGGLILSNPFLTFHSGLAGADGRCMERSELDHRCGLSSPFRAQWVESPYLLLFHAALNTSLPSTWLVRCWCALRYSSNTSRHDVQTTWGSASSVSSSFDKPNALSEML